MKLIFRAFLILTLGMILSSPAYAAITGDLDGDRIVSEAELTDLILDYLDAAYLNSSSQIGLGDLRAASHIHAYYPRTVVDSAGRNVTIYKPVERIVALAGYNCEVLRSLKADDKLVAISDDVTKSRMFFPRISKLPSVGTSVAFDIERMISLEPDMVLTFGTRKLTYLKEKLTGTDIEVVGFYFYKPKILSEEVNKLGYLLERENEAEKFNNFHESIQNSIKNKTKDISEKPTVYPESFYGEYLTATKNTQYQWIIDISGGVNIAADLPGGNPSGNLKVDPEWVVQQNPDIIMKGGGSSPLYGSTGYEFDDASGAMEWRGRIMKRPELKDVNAVKNGSVYIHNTAICGFLSIPYYAKIFHPDIFSDLDPPAIHQQYLTEFQRLNYNLSEQGVFMYPNNTFTRQIKTR